MISPQQSLATLAPRPPSSSDGLPHEFDEDVPLGWECANPALQIDCWGEQPAKIAAARD